jgi:beta-glucosidase
MPTGARQVFPPEFLWGAATSSHQVEGGCMNNNWCAFESAVDSRGRPRIAGGQKAEGACRHWERFKDDIGLLKALGLNAYRFSVEWSKIEPREGCWDESVLKHYEEVVDALLEAGVVPMVTLHHFTDPLWFSNRGGFLQKESPAILARFARRVYERLSDRVQLWCTINEPCVYAVNGYVTGEFPPALHSFEKAGAVLGNLMRAHARVYVECKSVDPSPQIGLATNVFIYAPARPLHPMDHIAALLAHRNMNTEIFRCLNEGEFDFHFPFIVREKVNGLPTESFDFVGINYYTRFHLRFSLGAQGHVRQILNAPPDKVTDMGWEIFPEGLAESLRMVASRTKKPIYVTENGLADDGDTKRALFFKEHLSNLRSACEAGIDVRGYFCWSLMDNFEWAHGFTRRFGLYHVDFASQRRSLRKGSETLRDLIREIRNDEKA